MCTTTNLAHILFQANLQKVIGETIQDLGIKTGSKLGLTIIKITLIVWLPSAVIWYTVQYLFPGPQSPNYFATTRSAIIISLLLAPILETQIMRIVFFLIEKYTSTESVELLLSSTFWGLMHIYSVSWGLHAVWAFYLLGKCFLKLKKNSLNNAMLLVTLVHMLCNLLSYGVSILDI
jgi:hypothetical protein